MIVVDSSALEAILEEEPEHRQFKTIIEAAQRRIISAVNLYEAGLVMLGRRGTGGINDVRDLVKEFDFEIAPFDFIQADLALAAYARFGKGIDPRARLNMGDCAAYALARIHNAPLLYKGNDFVHTDVIACQ